MSGVYALPPGVDFPGAVLAGLAQRLEGAPPEAWARTTILVNSGRMARRLLAAFEAGPARLLPRILPISEAEALSVWPEVAPARTGLALSLELARLIETLIARDSTLAPASAAFDLARSLAELIDEMEGEGVGPDTLARLDVAAHAAHWQRSRGIVEAAYAHFGRRGTMLPGPEARRARIVAALIARWQARPPEGPVLIAGSTGSRGATRALMAAVAQLPDGHVILPGFDGHMPHDHWEALARAPAAEDHPQYRHHALLTALGLSAADVQPWAEAAAPDPARNRLVSLALCPAPVTDRWRAAGADLGDLAAATQGLALLEAPSPRAEAGAIALRLRAAVAEGARAALISPDRELTRQVAAALSRWGIAPDDSGGTPLQQTPPGRFLRLTAALIEEPPDLPRLLSLLKHPLAATGAERGPHLRAARELELFLRDTGIAEPDATALARFAKRRGAPVAWIGWLRERLSRAATLRTPMPLPERIAAHRAFAEEIAAGPEAPGGAGALWDAAAGRAADEAMAALARAAPAYDADIAPRAYGDLLRTHLGGLTAQDPDSGHPDVMIWGTLEARAGGIDLAVLGGLNAGTWPALPPPDPWLNRRMRADAGLTLPERQIGLSAHDFQQAAAAPTVLLSRALRDAEAETVASRWLNRLTTLLHGLGPGGAAALEGMQARGRALLAQHAALDRPAAPVPPSRRPSPRPPLAARPTGLFVTRITQLIRDPYAIYARHVLGLQPLGPRLLPADARARGTALHKVMEAFLRRHAEWRNDPDAARAALRDAAATLAAHAPDAGVQALWRARISAAADGLVDGEMARLAEAEPVMLEEVGQLPVPGTGFTLRARPDRIDRRADGSYAVRDYKSGTPPTEDQVRTFEVQLPLEAAMAEAGAFPGLPPAPVTALTYISLKPGGPDREIAPEGNEGRLADLALEGLQRLIAAYGVRGKGYTAQRAAETVRFAGDYDHLSRKGEWALSDPPEAQDVGPPDAGPA